MLLCIVTECIFFDSFYNLDTDSEVSTKITTVQHHTWATLGFLRGMVACNKVGNAFCTDKWMKLIMKLIDKPSTKLAQSFQAEQQVCVCLFMCMHIYTSRCIYV